MTHGNSPDPPLPESAPARSTADVLIVGAGPAGSWAAASLARRGARVILFDPSHPREKPCGGGLSRRALQVVGETVRAAGLPGVVVRAATFEHAASAASPYTVTFPLQANDPLDSTLVVTSRSAFDRALLQRACDAGTTFVPARVLDVTAGAAGAEVRTAAGTYRAPVVLGADGANSLVRRRVHEPFRRDQLSIATGFFAHGVNLDHIRIACVGTPPGYIWSFPRPGHLAVGVCAQADAGFSSHDLRRLTDDWLHARGLADGARLERYAWPIPSLAERDWRTARASGPGWMLLGDAAGLVDPLTREGIFFALQSGAWAADAIAAGGIAAYESRVRDELIPELQRAARIRDAFFHPRFTRLLVDALAGSRRVREVMIEMMGGTQSYRGLKRRLVRTFEFGLAWRLLAMQWSSITE
ncbi:MAG TPA: geranylgeranyl reductase family protein [Vicinamibacterales bacterium]|nr:geranylgeranyl reductase family protein [Vicinamibacterales bacterium]